MAENFIEKKYGKKAFFYLLVTIILLSSIGLLSFGNNDSIDSFYYIAQVLCLTIGILHVVFIYKFLPVQKNEFAKGLIITLLLLLCSSIIVAIIYYFRKSYFSFLTYLLVFAIPYLCYQVYLFLIDIPASRYKLWYYPVNEDMPDLDMIDLSQIEVVQFVFNKKPQDTVKTSFTSKAPLNMTLGQLFFIFINDYNEKNSQNTIAWMSEQKTPFGWAFYRKGKWFSKNFYFDPELSFRDNRIQPNEIIHAVRIE
ncbi:MAG TPA: TssN family type VI secretion system protein [Puia sp.]|nr:TssN family type VI secretion system protein [Puia sp.]